MLRGSLEPKLDAAIAMVNQRRLAPGHAITDGLLQGIEHERGVGGARRFPAGNAPCEHVDHEGDIDKATTG